MSVGSVDGGPGKRISERGVVWYAAPHYLLRSVEGTLTAVAFDRRTFDVEQDALRVEGVRSGAGPFSTSSNGTMVQGVPSASPPRTSLEWIDRSGRTIREIAPRSEKPGELYYALRLSPDGQLVAYEHHLGLGGGDLFVTNVRSGKTMRETFDPKNHYGFPAWSPDGKQLVYSATKSGGGDLNVKTIGRSDGRLLGPSTAFNSSPSDWSRDGTTIVFDRISAETQSDVWTMKADGSATSKLIASSANEMQGVLSPDGRWIAYASDEDNARFEIFVRPYPTGTDKWKISTDGGEAPRWRADGKELFFIAPARRGRRLMAVPIDAAAGFKWDTPAALFTRTIRTTPGFLRSGFYYDVAPDGQSIVPSSTTRRQG